MYPIERYLFTLKSYVRNKSRPKGSIEEGYLVEECLTFYSRNLHDDEFDSLMEFSNFTSKSLSQFWC
ncbi:hypothetical protein AAC387_Pa01g2479 [Persea americana]